MGGHSVLSNHPGWPNLGEIQPRLSEVVILRKVDLAVAAGNCIAKDVAVPAPFQD